MNARPAEPIFFGDDARPLAGWLHHVAGNAPAFGVVLCNPFGYEAVCAHRSLRHLAEAIAAAGYPALRFDYDGTGDSAGDDMDAARLPAWIRSIHAAVEAIERQALVRRVALFGLRLGALVAAYAAMERDDVAALLAFAPVVSGAAYLRELRILQGASGLGDPPAGAAVDPSVQEALGFRLSADTRAALQQADLAACARKPAENVLVLDRADLPAADKWLAALGRLGAGVEARRVGGYVEMVLDPHKAAVPVAAVESCVAYLKSLAVAPAALASAPAVTDLVRKPPAASPSLCMSLERHVRAGLLHGIATIPAHPTGRAFLLLNAGAVHRIGPNRMYTVLARRWAARGHLCLRVDATGIGDTPPRPGAPENVVYGPHAVDDVAEAVAWLRDQPGVTDVRVIGLCSGAYHAFKAAVAGQPIDGVVMINPLTFFWKEGQSLDYPAFRVAGEAARYRRSVLEPDKWKKLLRGRVNLLAVEQTMVRNAASIVANRARDLSRTIGRPLKDDLGAELAAVAARGVALQFVFATGDPGLALLRRQGGRVVPALQRAGKLTIDMIDGPDHTFTPVWSHAALAEVLDRVLRA